METQQKTERVFIKMFSIEQKKVIQKYFDSFDQAKIWGYQNIDNFNIDMINYVDKY